MAKMSPSESKIRISTLAPQEYAGVGPDTSNTIAKTPKIKLLIIAASPG
jgi:hypothetical protein